MRRHSAAHRVLIIGSGFGGLFAARALRRAPMEVTIVDRTNHHLFQPLLYQVATGILSEGDIAPPTRDILRRQPNARVVMGDVVDIDLDRRAVTAETMGLMSTWPYDGLIVAAGASPSYFGHDEFRAHAPSLKTIDDALEVRGRIFGAFEMAEIEPDPARRRAWLTFAVVGAGATGVELAGEIADLSRRTLLRNFRTIEPAEAKVILLDATDAALGAFPPRLQARALHALESLGVEVSLGATVTGLDENGLDVRTADAQRQRIEARTKIWAAGVQGSPLGVLLAASASTSIDRTGRVRVQPDCSLPGHPEVFVVGDLMALDHLPAVAEVAMQSGRHAARTIAARLADGAEPGPFRYRDLGMTAAISRFRAVTVTGRAHVSGPLGWLIWLFVHLVFLTGFKNRFSALAGWTVAFLGRGRRQRTITSQQVLARTTLLERHELHMRLIPVPARGPLREASAPCSGEPPPVAD